MIKSIHPFPARMAPELALEALKGVGSSGLVVDPMMGSGTVIRQSIDLGLEAVGFDMDPLAVLMSGVWTTPVNDELIEAVYAKAVSLAGSRTCEEISLPWIDDDEETARFVDYWFGAKQRAALRRWSNAIRTLSEEASRWEMAALNVVKIALSRIIVTKEQCASLARDTSHSRPHRVGLSSDYCVDSGLERSLRLVRRRLLSDPPPKRAAVFRGDARALPLADGVADAIITSPPYLNAIDYLRGHRMSLVWLGHTLGELRRIRSASIGSERVPDPGSVVHAEVKLALGDLRHLPRRDQGIIDRFIADVVMLALEVRRVLKPGAVATMVVGDSTIKGVFIRNSDAMAKALQLQGMRHVATYVRELPAHSRYLPTSAGSALSNRMRQETVLSWVN